MASLLEKWRAFPDDTLGDALTGALRHVAPNAPPRDQEEWLSRAREVRPDDLAELGALLGSLRTRKLAEVSERVRALARLGADPRVAAALGDLIREVPFTSNSSAETWDALLEALFVAGDPRAMAWLAETRRKVQPLRQGFRDLLEPRLDATLERLRNALVRGAGQTLDEDTRRAIAALPAVPTKPSTPRDLAALLAEVYARPFDDAPRLVLADWFQEQGDPRGELITLQCLKKGDPEAEKRVAALLRKHGKAWLGELAPFAFDYEFARGFPVKLTLKAKNELEAAKTDAIAAFATIEELDVSRTAGHLPRGARALRWLRITIESALPAIAAAGLEHLEGLEIKRLEHEDDFRRFQRSPSARNLRRLVGVPVEWLDEGLLGQLETLTLPETDDAPLDAAALSAVSRHRGLTVIAPGRTHRTTIRNVDGHVDVDLELTLGEADEAWSGQRPVDIEHSTRSRDGRLAAAFETGSGRTLVRSLTVSCVARAPRLVVPSVQTESKARLRTAIEAWAARAEALARLDLQALGGAVTQRDAAVARDVPMMPQLEHTPRLLLTNERLFVLQQRTVVLDAGTLAFQTTLPRASRLTPDGRTLVHVSGSIYVTDTRTGATRTLHRGWYPSDVGLSRDAARVGVLLGEVYMDRTLEIAALDGPDGSSLTVLFERKAVDNARLSPDGRLVAVGRSEKLSLFAVDEPKAPGVVLGGIDVDNYTPVEFSPSGRTLAVQDSSHVLHVFDVETRALRAEVPLASRGTHVCNDELVVAGGDQGLLVIDLATKTLRTLLSTPVRSVALSPDGRVAARIDHALVALGLDGAELARIECRD